MPKKKLTEQHKLFIIEQLACFVPVQEITHGLKKNFGLEVSRQLIESYCPDKTAGRKLPQRYKDLFDGVRNRYIDDINLVPISSLRYRLEVLQKALEQAQKIGNIPLLLKILEQAAKEVGGYYYAKKVVGVEIAPQKDIRFNFQVINNPDRDNVSSIHANKDGTPRKKKSSDSNKPSSKKVVQIA